MTGHVAKNRRDLTNQKFDKVIAIKPAYTNGKRLYWECICECGNICYKQSTELIRPRQKTQSCGCNKNKFKLGKENKNWKGYEEIPLQYFNIVRNCAKERNIHFDITIKDMWNQYIKQDRKCAFTGIKLNFFKSHKDRKSGNLSLDRIDSSKGYTSDNIQFVLKILNTMKGKMNNNVFISLCHSISKNNQSINITNDFESKIQEYTDEIFDMRSR